MNSFVLYAVGHLARAPELIPGRSGGPSHTRFCLIGNDYAGKDEAGASRESATSVWFVAFGAVGEAIAKHCGKGDQLIVQAHLRGNVWTDKAGAPQYDHSFIVEGFRFGAPGRARREAQEKHES